MVKPVESSKINSILRKHICWKLIKGISSLRSNGREKMGEKGVNVGVSLNFSLMHVLRFMQSETTAVGILTVHREVPFIFKGLTLSMWSLLQKEEKHTQK